MWFEVRNQIRSCACGCPVVSAPFVEKTVLSTLNSVGNLVENQLTVDARVYLRTPNSVSLICISILTPVLHGLDYSSFIVKFWNPEVRVLQLCSFFQVCLGFWVPCISIWISGSSCHFLQSRPLEFGQGLHWICRSVWSAAILTVFTLPTHEYGISFHLLGL